MAFCCCGCVDGYLRLMYRAFSVHERVIHNRRPSSPAGRKQQSALGYEGEEQEG